MLELLASRGVHRWVWLGSLLAPGTFSHALVRCRVFSEHSIALCFLERPLSHAPLSCMCKAFFSTPSPQLLMQLADGSCAPGRAAVPLRRQRGCAPAAPPAARWCGPGRVRLRWQDCAPRGSSGEQPRGSQGKRGSFCLRLPSHGACTSAGPSVCAPGPPQVLVEAGASVLAEDSFGATPLDDARRVGSQVGRLPFCPPSVPPSYHSKPPGDFVLPGPCPCFALPWS